MDGLEQLAERMLPPPGASRGGLANRRLMEQARQRQPMASETHWLDRPFREGLAEPVGGLPGGRLLTKLADALIPKTPADVVADIGVWGTLGLAAPAIGKVGATAASYGTQALGRMAGKLSQDCVKWLVDRAGPGSRLAHCALHQDEGAPHLHATLIVADEQGRLGWNRVRNRFTVKGKTGTLLMSGLQDNFHAAVGRKYDLERGEVGSAREHAPVDRELGIRIRVEEERNRTRDAKVQAGQRIAQVLERADGEAARKYRGRLDDATRATADAEGRAALATEERDEARRERDEARQERDRADADANSAVQALQLKGVSRDALKQENERLKRRNREIYDAGAKLAERVKQQDEKWQTRLDEQVAAAKQESAAELTKVRRERGDLSMEVGTLMVERDQARRERSQAQQEVRTMTVARDEALEKLDRESRFTNRLVGVVRERGGIDR